jgi:hypothetical protein
MNCGVLICFDSASQRARLDIKIEKLTTEARRRRSAKHAQKRERVRLKPLRSLCVLRRFRGELATIRPSKKLALEGEGFAHKS